MAGVQDEYKSKLHRRNASQFGEAFGGESGNAQDTENIGAEILESPEEPAETEVETEKRKLLEVPVVDMKDFEVVDMEDKLNLLMSAINKINTNFHHKFEEMNRQITASASSIGNKVSAIEEGMEIIEEQLDDLEGYGAKVVQLENKVKLLEEANAAFQDDMAVVKGILQVHDKALDSTKKKVIALTARSMARNVIISGIGGDKGDDKGEAEVAVGEEVSKENCKEKVLQFFRNKMKMSTEDDEVEVAHSIGKMGKQQKPRQIVVRCKQELRDRIFGYTKNLKDVKNEAGDAYFVRVQLLEPPQSEKRERENRMREIKKRNKELPDTQKHKQIPVHIKKNVLYIN